MMMLFEFPLILDAATGTELIKKGYDGSMSSEQWTLIHPEAIQDIQRSYIEAGSKVLYTPTFGANRVKMGNYGEQDKVSDYNLKLAALSREIAGKRAYVAGDLAPTSLSTPPMGEASFAEIYDTYLEQASALEKAGVDLFVIETISSVADARAAILAVKSIRDKPVMVSFTCDKNGRTFTGADVAAACVTLQSMGADIFGLNCSYGPEDMVPQLKRLSEFSKVPLLAKPNAGIPETVDGKTVYDCPPDEFVRFVPEMIKSGVKVFGGCCGTDATHIKALSEVLKDVRLEDTAAGDSEFLSTERHVFSLEELTAPERFIQCGEDLEDDAADFDEDEMIGIDLDNDPDLEELESSQWSFSSPVCFRCQDAEILESALRVFQGRAAFTGTLPQKELDPLVNRYGLVVL